jgi:hypothetical protein
VLAMVSIDGGVVGGFTACNDKDNYVIAIVKNKMAGQDSFIPLFRTSQQSTVESRQQKAETGGRTY